jgi:hypothetical protein
MEFGMNVAEDFKKMTDQFKADYQNRIATVRGLFRDTRQLLAPVRPELKRETQHMLTGFRSNHKKMATELQQFLKETMQRMRTEGKRMMQEFHGQSNHRKTQCKQMHGAAQAFFKAMAHAKQMHPLRGGQPTEGTAKPAGRKMRRSRKQHTPAS